MSPQLHSGTLVTLEGGEGSGKTSQADALATLMLEHWSHAKPQQPGMPYEQLTQRELQVLQLAADGLSNKEIADRLAISEKTVKNHIANIFSKLSVNDRTHAILYALRKGLVTMSLGDAG